MEGLEILKFLGFRVWGSGVLGLGFWVLGFWVWGLGFGRRRNELEDVRMNRVQ